jgi:hypothetical protein
VPFRNVNIEMSGAYHACFDANSFTGEQADKIAYGFQHYWVGISNLTFDYEVTFPDESCDIVFDEGTFPGHPEWVAVTFPTSNG